MDNTEHEEFIHCVAAPVRGARGEVLAAMSLSVPKVLLDLDGLLELVPALLAAAAAASVECGWLHRTDEEEVDCMAKVAINPEGATPPPVPLSQGIRKGNILQVAGQVAFDPATGEIVGDTRRRADPAGDARTSSPCSRRAARPSTTW